MASRSDKINENKKMLDWSIGNFKGNNMNMTLNGENQDIQDGKEITKITKDNDSEDDNKSESENESVDETTNTISFTKDILPFILPLVCFLTLGIEKNSFIELLTLISTNPMLIETIDEMTFIWWGKKDMINMIKELTEKCIENKSVINNIVSDLKMSIKSMIDEPEKLLKFIQECLKPNDAEKKQNGEVFTPIELIIQMLNKLDEYYKKQHGISIFSNKDLKWYDPACGMGNFPIVVFLRLMEGLKTVIKDKEKRKKHILENMIYMSELNKKNIVICKQIFDIGNAYKLNMYEGDSLKVDTKKEFNVNKFDIIMGNPPYNASGSIASGNTIWQNFVLNSLEKIKKDGHLVFVHPCGWRKPNTEKGKFYGLFEKMCKDNTMHYLEIHNTKDGMKTFHCGTRYDWYILQKSKNINTITKILDENEKPFETNLNNWEWLPNGEFDIIFKLIAKNDEKECNILQSMSAYDPRKKWISKTKSKEFKYEVIHSTPKNGIRYVYSNINDKGFFGISKVIFGESGINNPVLDLDGKYAMSQCAMAIEISSKVEGENLIKVLISDRFNKIIKACSWSSFRIEWGMFKNFKKDFYKYIDIEKEKVVDKKIDKKIAKKKIESSSDSDTDSSSSSCSDNKKTKKKIVKKVIKKVVKKKVIVSSSESESELSSDDDKPKKKTANKK
jgi:hypothetical protein